MTDRKEYIKNWKENNKEKISQHNKKYAKKNKEKILKKNELWRKANEFYNFVWCNTNRERSNAIKQNRRSKESGKIDPLEWKEILTKYGNKCLACGSSENIQMDHVIPLAKGGRHSVDNLQPLCSTCNQRKATKSTDYR